MGQEKSAKEIHEKRQKLWDASVSRHSAFIDLETALFRSEFVEERKCPVCGSAKSQKMFDKEGGTYVSCQACEMVFLNPVLKSQYLEKYYSSNHDVQAEIVADDSGFYSRIYGQGLRLINDSISEKGNLLDFGCSSGFFLNVAKEFGFSETVGVELNKSEAEVAKKRGHTVHNCLLEESGITDQFNAITLWDVFEHLIEGDYYLNLFKKYLSKDGVLFLQIPNGQALAPRIMHDQCNMFDGLEHVNLYGPEQVRKLAERCDYRVVNMTSVISETNVLNNYVNYENPYSGGRSSDGGFMGLMPDEQILETFLGYKLQVVLSVK